MTLADALASVDRLCPAEVGRTLRAHMTRPTGGHVIGRVVEQQSTRPGPRAEADEEPTRRERRPSTQDQVRAVTGASSDRLAAVTADLRKMGDRIETALEDEKAGGFKP